MCASARVAHAGPAIRRAIDWLPRQILPRLSLASALIVANVQNVFCAMKGGIDVCPFLENGLRRLES